MEATKTSKEKVQSTWNKRPLIISGPCSAETEEQVLETAQRLAATGKVDMLRAGIWKPRTRPGSFEGVGAKGLSWLAQAKKANRFAYHCRSCHCKTSRRCFAF
jgi:chorismate mutase